MTLFEEGPPPGEGGVRGSIGFVSARAKRARREVKDIRQALDRAEAEQSFWDELSKSITRGLDGAIVYQLQQADGYLRTLRERKDPDWQSLADLLETTRERVREATRSLGRAFPQAARNAGLTIDPSSRHPVYTFMDRFLTVELNERSLNAHITSREGYERRLGLDLGQLIDELRALMDRIFNREFKPESFLRSLHTAYVAVVRSERLADGTEVPIRRVLHRLGKNLNRFSADEFNVDLARAVQTGQTSIDGKKLHLNHTRNTRQGMLLHGLEQGGYVGFISFKKDEAV